MNESSRGADPRPTHAGQFATTQWGLVLSARDGNSPEAQEALERFCRLYWPPLYAFIRREGYQPAEAQDLTQAFFARLLERNYLAHVRHQEGRFRSFLLTFLKHFLSEQRDRAKAQKRGGGKVFISLDQFTEEERQAIEPHDPRSPDQVYDRRWAETLMRQALNRLEAEYTAAGQRVLFDHLKDFHPRAPESLSHAEMGRRLGMTEAAVKSAGQRLRRRHRELLREEIAQTLARPEDLEEEIRYLLEVLGREGG